MKRLTFIAALLMSMACTALAQDENKDGYKPKSPTQTESNFNMQEFYINTRDYVYLKNKTKMIIELNNPEQYNELKNLDSLIYSFIADIAFFKDSLENAGGSVRIDYAVDQAFPFAKIRFKKHAPDGDIFMHRHNDVAKLKLDQDTVHIFFRHDPVLERPNNTRKDWAKNHNYNFDHARMYQVTFCVNNYTDLKKIADDKSTLLHIMDTLMVTKRERTKVNPHYNPSSARYYPFGPDTIKTEKCNTCLEKPRFKQYSGLVSLEHPAGRDIVHRSDLLTLVANVGAGTIRNSFAPYAEIGMSLIKYDRRIHNDKFNERFVLTAFVSGYYLFDHNADGAYYVKDNWFANLCVGEESNINFGVGYLFSKKGDYFKGVTTKMFMDVTLLKKGLTLSPELIFTNDFKQVFPGLTLKVF